MEPKRLAAAAAAFLFAALSLAAQDGSTEEKVFAPYPSRIRVGVRDDTVLISWEDSPDVTDGYVLYRHANEPTSDNFSSAVKIGEAASGASAFEYRPPDDGAYYYLVLGKSSSGVYELFIPLKNVSLVSFAAPGAPQPSTAGVPAGPAASPIAGTAPAPSQTAVTRISSALEGDSILLSYEASADAGRLVLYRGTSPFSSSAAVLDAVVAAIVQASDASYRDYPVPGIAYYYALVPERDLLGGVIRFESGRNAIQTPITIPAGSYRIGLPTVSPASRAIPLPYIVLTRRLSDADPVIREDLAPAPRELSAETNKAVASLLGVTGPLPSIQRPLITIFPEDLKSTSGVDYSLRSIVSEQLSKGNYAKASEQLELYLSLPRSASSTAKARFYRAQALALSGAYQEAFFDLLRSQEAYYLETQPWLDYVLSKLAEE